MTMTGIEWTNEVWNPTTGCDRVSPGCDNCYALTMAKRLKGMGAAKYQRDGNPRTSGPGFGVSVHPDVLGKPLSWKAPRRVFVNSMSDLFHDEVPASFIAEVFAVMARTPRHTYQLLTKRHARMRALLGDDGQRLLEHAETEEVAEALYERWPLPNVHLGVSVENQQWADIRIPALLDTPAAVRWLSMEPLLGPVDIWAVPGMPQFGCGGAHNGVGTAECPTRSHHHHDARCRPPLDWVVVGGESGPGARPMHPDWVRSLRNQCTSTNVPFFFKQHGSHAPALDRPGPRDVWVGLDGETVPWQPDDGHVRRGGEEFRSGPLGRDSVLMRPTDKKTAGRLLDGRTWDEYPEPALAVTP